MTYSYIQLGSTDVIEASTLYEIHLLASGPLTGFEQQIATALINFVDGFTGAQFLWSQVTGNEIVFQMLSPAGLSFSPQNGAKTMGLVVPALILGMEIPQFIALLAAVVSAIVGLVYTYLIYKVVTNPAIISGAGNALSGIGTILPLLGGAAIIIAGAYIISAFKGSSMEISKKGIIHKGVAT